MSFHGSTSRYESSYSLLRANYLLLFPVCVPHTVDGKAVFLKLLSPKDDMEIEEEAKRLISLFPIYKPCKCASEAVPCQTGINLRLYPK